MHEPSRSRSLFVDAIEIPAWLEADRDTPYADRLHRDRVIARELAIRDPLIQVRAWWARLRHSPQQDGLDAEAVERLLHGRRLIAWVMIGLGALVGSGVAFAVFRYDGTWPVNVVTALATLVLLQIFLVFLTLILMVPDLPGVRALQNLLGGLNPATLAASVFRRLHRFDDARARALFWHDARGPSAARFARWQMLVWSQAASVAFNVSVLCVAFGLIAFTDLAFGWSTTLRMDARDVLRITNALSWPWREVWPAAVPTPELVETSRFYRLASATPRAVAATELTGWWPFLLAALITYGLIPRVLLLVFAMSRLRSATKRLLLDDPRVRALLDRMQAAEIELGARDAEAVPKHVDRHAAVAPSVGAESVAIVWSSALPRDAVREWVAQQLQRRVSESFAAGATLAGDEELIERVAATTPPAVLILVRAWEAPLLDLQDFIGALRARVGTSCSLIIVPVGLDRTVATESQRETWSRWTAKVADPALYLESGA